MRAGALLYLPFAVGLALAGCFGSSPPPGSKDDVVLYVDGLVWTGVGHAEAFAVQNGTFVGVGSTDAMRGRYPDASEVDLKQERVVPGLVDSHSHFVRVAAAWNCDLSNNPFEPTFDNSRLAGIEYEVSRAQIAQYHEQTNRSGKTPVDDRGGLPNKANAKRGLECAMRLANAMGLTMNVEAGISSWDYFDVLQELEKDGKLTMRHSLYITPPLLDEAKQRGIRNGYGTPFVQISGIKYYSDGWLGPRTSALLQPYNDRPLSRGVLFLEQAEAHQWVKAAKEAGLKVATHSIGDHGVAVMLNAYKDAVGNGNGSEYRYAFEHAQVLQQRFIGDIAMIGAVASYQLSFATTDQRFAEQALGAERVRNAYIWKTLLDRGVVLAGGSDFPIEVLPPLWGLQRVVTRQDLDGTPPGGWQAQERLSVEEALRTITWNAAYNVFREDDLGSIEEGKRADFVILERDVFTIPPNEIAKTCVKRTYVDGDMVYDNDRDVLCGRVRYAGVLPNRDVAVIEAIHERIEAETRGLVAGP